MWSAERGSPSTSSSCRRRSLGEWWFQQEYLCTFGDSVGQVFRTEDIEAAISTDVEPLFPDSPRWGEPENELSASDDVEPLFS